jgi:hypothetical protein
MGWEITREGSPNAAQRLRPWMRKFLDGWLAEATDDELAKFLSLHAKRWGFVVEPRDKPFLERVKSTKPSIARYADELLARLEPEKRLEHLLVKQTPFELAARELAGTIADAEVDRILQAAKAGAQKKAQRPFGPCSVRVLWNECGKAGRDLLAKNLAACSTSGMRTLVWLTEEITVEDAALRLAELDLTEIAVSDLLSEYEQLPIPQKERHPHCADAAESLLTVAHRFYSFDLEDGTIPPGYPRLLEDLCEASAGALALESAEVKEPKKGFDATDTWTVTFRLNGKDQSVNVANQRDWFDAVAIFESLNKLSKSLKRRDRFVRVLEGGQEATVIFGPPEVVKEYAQRMAIPLFGEDGGPEQEEDFRERCMARIKQALKKRA